MVSVDVQAAIEDVIRERLGTDRILAVETSRDSDLEDEEVLWVTVVVDDESKLDDDHILGLVRHLQPHLDRFKEAAFPVITFRSAQEHKEAA